MWYYVVLTTVWQVSVTQWFNVDDAGPTLKQHYSSVSCQWHHTHSCTLRQGIMPTKHNTSNQNWPNAGLACRRQPSIGPAPGKCVTRLGMSWTAKMNQRRYWLPKPLFKRGANCQGHYSSLSSETTCRHPTSHQLHGSSRPSYLTQRWLQLHVSGGSSWSCAPEFTRNEQ